ncbi:hypothetical protein KPK64_03056 [Proteus mirabilis]|nr:hypothetical protein KPK64_03056 [Proteus mirabilis]
MLSFEQLSIDIAQFRWLGKRTWQPLLKSISLDIKPGKMLALVGAAVKVKVYSCKVHWDYYLLICEPEAQLNLMGIR